MTVTRCGSVRGSHGQEGSTEKSGKSEKRAAYFTVPWLKGRLSKVLSSRCGCRAGDHSRGGQRPRRHGSQLQGRGGRVSPHVLRTDTLPLAMRMDT